MNGPRIEPPWLLSSYSWHDLNFEKESQSLISYRPRHESLLQVLVGRSRDRDQSEVFFAVWWPEPPANHLLDSPFCQYGAFPWLQIDSFALVEMYNGLPLGRFHNQNRRKSLDMDCALPRGAFLYYRYSQETPATAYGHRYPKAFRVQVVEGSVCGKAFELH